MNNACAIAVEHVEAFGGITRDLSLEKETEGYGPTPKNKIAPQDLCSQRLETASPVLHDAVTTHFVTASQPFMTASARTTQPKI
ncbi:hypothetical protein Tco_1154287 [Tanacetum coccineum]